MGIVEEPPKPHMVIGRRLSASGPIIWTGPLTPDLTGAGERVTSVPACVPACQRAIYPSSRQSATVGARCVVESDPFRFTAFAPLVIPLPYTPPPSFQSLVGGGGASHWWSRASVASVEDQTLGPAAVMYCTWYSTLRRWNTAAVVCTEEYARYCTLLLLPFNLWHRRTAACALDMTASGHHTESCRRNGVVPCRFLSHFDLLVRPGRGSFLPAPKLHWTCDSHVRERPLVAVIRPASNSNEGPSITRACMHARR